MTIRVSLFSALHILVYLPVVLSIENRALIKILQQRQKQLLTIERTIKDEKRESKQKRKNKKPTSDNISIRQKSIVPKVVTDFLGLDEGTEYVRPQRRIGFYAHTPRVLFPGLKQFVQGKV